MKSFLKQICAVLCGILCAASLTPAFATAAADDDPLVPVVLALGDETLQPASDGTSAVDILAEYYHGTAVNRSVEKTGPRDLLESSELLESIQTDADMRADIAKADVILVSVGTADLLQTIFYRNTSYPGSRFATTFVELMNRSSSADAPAIIEYVLTNLPGTIATLNQNLRDIKTALDDINASATVVFSTLVNFMAVDFDSYLSSGQISDNRIAAAEELREFLNVALQGGINGVANYYQSYYVPEATMAVPESVNAAIRAIPNCSYLDLYQDIYGDTGETGLADTLTELPDLLMTYVPSAQVALAAAAVSSDVTGCGDGSVLSAAASSAGTTGRASLDRMVTEAAAGEFTALPVLGDPDGSGSIDVADATAALAAYAAVASDLDVSANVYARMAIDVDADNAFSVSDAYYILMYYAQVAAGKTATWDEILGA